MYKLPKEQRDLLISQMPLSELQTNLTSYVDRDALSHEGHRKRMHKYTLNKRKRDEEAKIKFKCDWETVEPFWATRCKPNTLKTYRTAHQSFMEYATSLLPLELCPHTAFLNLLDMPTRVKEMFAGLKCSPSTKVSRMKYVLSLIDQFPGIDNHLQACSVDKLRDFYEHLLLLEIEAKAVKDAEVPDEEQLSYVELLEQCNSIFGHLSPEYVFIRTMLEIPCRGDLVTMEVFRDEDSAKARGAENFIILPEDETKSASYKLSNFKTMNFTNRYMTSDDLSMELTSLFREKLGDVSNQEQPFTLFPKTTAMLTKLIKHIGTELNVQLSINILRHMLQKNAKATFPPEEYAAYNRKMLHSAKVATEIYEK